MLLRTNKKKIQRSSAQMRLLEYFGSVVQPDIVITSVINTIQTHAVCVEAISCSRSVFDVLILGKPFRVTYDKRHKELEDLQPLE